MREDKLSVFLASVSEFKSRAGDSGKSMAAGSSHLHSSKLWELFHVVIRIMRGFLCMGRPWNLQGNREI